MQIAHYLQVGYLEDGGLGVPVYGDYHPGTPHAHDMVIDAGDATSNVQAGSDGLAT